MEWKNHVGTSYQHVNMGFWCDGKGLLCHVLPACGKMGFRQVDTRKAVWDGKRYPAMTTSFDLHRSPPGLLSAAFPQLQKLRCKIKDLEIHGNEWSLAHCIAVYRCAPRGRTQFARLTTCNDARVQLAKCDKS